MTRAGDNNDGYEEEEKDDDGTLSESTIGISSEDLAPSTAESPEWKSIWQEM